VHRKAAGDFSEAFVDLAKRLKVADGHSSDTQMGPLANERRLAAMSGLTEDAVAKGAKLLLGGERIGSAGYFWKPTVLAEVPQDAKVFNDEPFGPVAAMRSFDTLDEAIAEANRLPYGLAAYAFTRSLKNADLIARNLEVGMLWINTPAAPSAEMPFGGVKDSGYGSEGGPEAVDAYLNVRAVATLNV
jgi:succinate-semialdehyde dehydrogenase/glutarate-semialdehyde dehydrogenase